MMRISEKSVNEGVAADGRACFAHPGSSQYFLKQHYVYNACKGAIAVHSYTQNGLNVDKNAPRIHTIGHDESIQPLFQPWFSKLNSVLHWFHSYRYLRFL